MDKKIQQKITSDRAWTLNPVPLVCPVHAYLTSLYRHALLIFAKSSQFPEVQKSIDAQKSGVKDPSICTWELAQLDKHGTGNTTVIGLRVQALFEVTFFWLNLFCSNTILTDLTKWSIDGKPRSTITIPTNTCTWGTVDLWNISCLFLEIKYFATSEWVITFRSFGCTYRFNEAPITFLNV